MMRIRPLVEADLPLLRSWMRDAPEAPAWSEDDLAAIVKAPSGDERRIRRGWVAEDSRSAGAGFVVATALAIPAAPAECELEFILVPPPLRGQGIGRVLMATVSAWAHELGAQEIRLEVRASNARALRLYGRCGFIAVGNRAGYYADPREDAVVMRSRIDQGRRDPPV